MSREQNLDAQIREYLDDGPRHLSLEQRDAIALATAEVAQRRGMVVPWWGATTRRLLQVAVAVVVIAVVTLVLGPRVDMPLIGGPQPTSLLWTPEGVDDPYPAPLRIEPVPGAPDVPAELSDAVEPEDDATWLFVDPVGDGRPGATGVADLVRVTFNHSPCWHGASVCIVYETASSVSRPFADPHDEWTAYGVVFDNDADGRPDMRFGVDTMPGDTLRAWSTDLHAGTTEVVTRSEVFPDHPRLWEVEFPVSDNPNSSPNLGYAYLGYALTSPAGRFYVWSAVIRDGELVSMDFAPDVGWLDGRPDDAE